VRFVELEKFIPGSRAVGDIEFSRVSTDSRNIDVGEVFVALKGPSFDGHAFCGKAIAQGAVALVVQSEMPETDVPQLIVPDTAVALAGIASLQRDTYGGSLIAITGSCGKTSVKGMLREICVLGGKTLATEGNMNNHIGVPLTLMRLYGDEDYAIVEAGTSGLGEIAYLGDIIRPDVALVNNVSEAHLSGLKSIENIAEEKGALYKKLGENGTAVINLDDAFAEKYLDENQNRRCIGFSFDKACAGKYDFDLVLGEKLSDSKGLKVVFKQSAVEVNLSVLGDANLSNALAAAACAITVGIDLNTVKQGLNNFMGASGRMQRLDTSAVHLLVDDSYNANPASMRAAIDFLSQQKESILVIGDMAELGEAAAEAHYNIGKYAADKKIEKLIGTGEHCFSAIEGFGANGEWYESQQDLIRALTSQDLSSKTILVKGSRSSKMENIVRAILELGEDAGC